MAIHHDDTNCTKMKNTLATLVCNAFFLFFLGNCTIDSEGLGVTIILPTTSGEDAAQGGIRKSISQTDDYYHSHLLSDAKALETGFLSKNQNEHSMAADGGLKNDDAEMDSMQANPDALGEAMDTPNERHTEGGLTPWAAYLPSDKLFVQARNECQAKGGTYGVTETGPVCTFDCTGAKRCGQLLVCPSNQQCRFLCDGANCKTGFDCSQAQGCSVECNSPSSCLDKVICGGKNCHVSCKGQGSCPNGVLLYSILGTIDCVGENSCRSVRCSGQRCTAQCMGKNSCHETVLSDAEYNQIRCSGAESCRGQIKCSGAQCSTTCIGVNSCDHGHGCNAALCEFANEAKVMAPPR